MPSGATIDALEETKSPALAQALRSARDTFTAANPLSCQLHQDATKYFPGGNTRTLLHSLPFPLTFKSGHACYLTSVDGETYLDFCGEYTSGLFGHSHPKIQAAIEDAMRAGWNYGGINDREVELARMVCERFMLDLVRFTNSGTEASMMAIAAALVYTDRKAVMVFSNSFHGNTINFPTPRPAKSVVLPHQFIVAPFNDLAGTQAVVSYQPAQSLAAIFVEPVQGAGGAVPASLEFLRGLRELATSTGAVLIIDETMTSRLSYHGQAHKLGIEPDMMTLGKWIGGGMTFGAFGGKREIMSMFDQNSGILAHSGTFNNNVFSMTTGIAGMKIYDADAVERNNALGDRMKAQLEDILTRHNIIAFKKPTKQVNGNADSAHMSHVNGSSHAHTNGSSHAPVNGAHHYSLPDPKLYVCGEGSMIAIHFAGSEARILKSIFFHHLIQHRIYIASRGFMSLCLDITQEHVDRFAEIFEGFVTLYKTDLILE